MFDGFLMSITNKLKKISTSLDLYEGKFDEISVDVGAVNTAVSNVGTKVDTVQTTSDEIKSLISSEVATAKNEILTEILSSSSGSGDLLVPVSAKTVSSYCTSSSYVTAVNVTGKGEFVGTLFSGNPDTSKTKVKVTVDGIKIWDGVSIFYLGHYFKDSVEYGWNLNSEYITAIDIPFSKSLKIEIYGVSTSYGIELLGSAKFFE